MRQIINFLRHIFCVGHMERDNKELYFQCSCGDKDYIEAEQPLER